MTVTFVSPSRFTPSRSAASCAVPTSVAYTRPGRSDNLCEPHRPGAEPRAHIGDRHARLQLEQLRELRHLELGSFDLPLGQACLLCSNREEQQKNENERTGNASHD